MHILEKTLIQNLVFILSICFRQAKMGVNSKLTCLLLLVLAITAIFGKPSKHNKHSKKAKTERPGKREFAKDFKLIGEQKKGCTYNDQKISHGTIAYQDVCGKFTCTDGYMAWYYFPNAHAFDICHVPAAFEDHENDGEEGK